MKNVNWMILSIVIIFSSACETKYEEVTVPNLFTIKIPAGLSEVKEKSKDVDLLYGGYFSEEAVAVIHYDQTHIDTAYVNLMRMIQGGLSLNLLKEEKVTKMTETKVNGLKAIIALIEGTMEVKDDDDLYLYGMAVFIEGKKNVYQLLVIGDKEELMQPGKRYQIIVNSFKELGSSNAVSPKIKNGSGASGNKTPATK